MNPSNQNNNLNFEVTFGPAGSGYLSGPPLPLGGRGQVWIRDGNITFHVQSEGISASMQPGTVTVALDQIANVGIKGRQVLFCVYPPGDDRTGTPLYIGSVWTKERKISERLFNALPRTLSPAVEHMASERNTFARSLHEVTPRAFVTPLILAINVTIFTAMVVTGVGLMNPSFEGLVRWGANYGPLTFLGDWWRVLSCTFVHIGIIHLAFNMWVLNSVGRLVERMYGNGMYLLIYLASGIVGSLASLCVHPNSVSAGASGVRARTMWTMLSVRSCSP